MHYVVVNEAGASVYSTSEIGREEFPECDALERSAISIGRRLQDPLSELVKIDPASIGVGLYQHDTRAKHLRDSLDDVVQSCVSFVGVELNSASTPLLALRLGHEPAHRPPRLRASPAERPVQEPAAADGSERLRRRDVRPGGRLPEDRRRRRPARRHLDSSRKLRRRPQAARKARRRARHAHRAGHRRPHPRARRAARSPAARRRARPRPAHARRHDRGPLEAGPRPAQDLPPPIFRKDVVKFEDLPSAWSSAARC